MVSPLASLGTNGILFRYFSKGQRDVEHLLIPGAIYLRAIGTIIALFVLLVFSVTSSDFFSQDFFIPGSIAILAFSLTFFEFFLFANNKASEATFIRIVGLMVFAGVKFYLVSLGADLISFLYAYSFELLFVVVVQFFLVLNKFNNLGLFVLNKDKIKNLFVVFRESRWIFISEITAFLHLKFSIVLIFYLANAHQTGIYSVSVRLTEALNFIAPALISVSFSR